MSRALRVLALVPYATRRVPGQRYRIEQWAPLLRQDGIDVRFSSFLSAAATDALYAPGRFWTKLGATLAGYVRRSREALSRGEYDVALVYREAALLGPGWLEGLLAPRVPLVFDFDDAIYLQDASPANAWARRFKSPQKAARLCAIAQHVTVGNATLAAYATPRARHVTVIPSTIDTDAYTLEPRPPNPKPVVGWTGSRTTLPHLQLLAPALASLRRIVDFDLHVVGGDVKLAGVETRCLPWRAETEVEDLRSFDVGLMPLPDDEWSRGKCGMKALQYMALGIVPVVSPVGINATLVRDGENGFHARSPEDWVDRIARILRERELRDRLGAAARRTVESQYSARVQAPRLARILREVAA